MSKIWKKASLASGQIEKGFRESFEPPVKKIKDEQSRRKLERAPLCSGPAWKGFSWSFRAPSRKKKYDPLIVKILKFALLALGLAGERFIREFELPLKNLRNCELSQLGNFFLI